MVIANNVVTLETLGIPMIRGTLSCRIQVMGRHQEIATLDADTATIELKALGSEHAIAVDRKLEAAKV
jgi:hypothetical protein